MFYHRELIKHDKWRTLILCGIIVLVSCPLFGRGIAGGHDLSFHFMRIEGLADELRRGIFPVRMSSAWMGGYGYPISIFYGDILLYVPAALRAMGVSILAAYKCYVVMINVGTALSAYTCFGKMFKSDTAAALCAFAYATAGYRIVCIYARAAVGEYTAMMFLPIVALAVYELYTASPEDSKLCRRYALILALGMTGVLTSHILTMVMVIFTILLLGVVLWRRTFAKQVLRGYGLAIIETLGLSAFFLVPFIDYFTLYYVEPMLIRHGIVGNLAGASMDGIKESVFSGQSEGAYLMQYFAVFEDMFGNGTIRISLTPGLTLMAVLTIALVCWIQGIATKLTKTLFCLAVAMLFVASDQFPWDFIYAHTAVGKFLGTVQFPWRYLTIAIVFMTMLVGAVYEIAKKKQRNRRDFSKLIIGTCVIMSLFYISNYSDHAAIRSNYDVEVNTYAYSGGEYLRVDTDVPFSFTGEGVMENMRQVDLLDRDGTHIELYCEAEQMDGTVELPVLNYKGYQVRDEYGNQYEVTDGTDNVIQFTIPAGFRGRIYVDFVPPWYWRLGDAVSLIFALVTCINAARKSHWLARWHATAS